jgi:hypothetical protein
MIIFVIRGVIRVDPVGFGSIGLGQFGSTLKKTYPNPTLFRTRVTLVGSIRARVNSGRVNSGSGLGCLKMIQFWCSNLKYIKIRKKKNQTRVTWVDPNPSKIHILNPNPALFGTRGQFGLTLLTRM